MLEGRNKPLLSWYQHCLAECQCFCVFLPLLRCCWAERFVLLLLPASHTACSWALWWLSTISPGWRCSEEFSGCHSIPGRMGSPKGLMNKHIFNVHKSESVLSPAWRVWLCVSVSVSLTPDILRWVCSSSVCVAHRGSTVSDYACCLWSSASLVHPEASLPFGSPSEEPPTENTPVKGKRERERIIYTAYAFA